MSAPELVRSTLGEEAAVASVTLGDDDALFVSPTRTLHYRGRSLLSDESVDEYPHEAERLSVAAGRRKATIELDYGLDGIRTLTVPNRHADAVLHPILAGVLSVAGVTDPGEAVRETFRFSELTLVITDHRLIKHVGRAVWDEEFEEFPYEDVSAFAVEEGRVATQFVLTVSGRHERFKLPNERVRVFRERLEGGLLAYHGIESISQLPESDHDERDADETTVGADTPIEPATVGSPEPTAEAASRRDPDGTNVMAGIDRLDALADALDEQRDLLDRQRREIDRLREELTPDR